MLTNIIVHFGQLGSGGYLGMTKNVDLGKSLTLVYTVCSDLFVRLFMVIRI